MPLLKQIGMVGLGLMIAPFAAPAGAQAPAAAVTVGVGAKVSDPSGAEVGTVIAVKGDAVVVKTDKHEAGLPKASFASRPDGLVIGLTRDQLNAEVEKSLAAQGPLLSVGATIYDPQGGVVGTVQELDDQFATVKLPNSLAKLPVGSFGRGPKGAMIGETATSLEAKVKAAGGSSGS